MKYTLCTLFTTSIIGCSANPGVRASGDVSEEAEPKIVDHLSALTSFLADVERADGTAQKLAAFRTHFVAQDPPLFRGRRTGFRRFMALGEVPLA